jgi:hypothetical protein
MLGLLRGWSASSNNLIWISPENFLRGFSSSLKCINIAELRIRPLFSPNEKPHMVFVSHTLRFQP